VDNISKHITYSEATRSQTATKNGIENSPSEQQLVAMCILAEKVFEPLRIHVAGPVAINSFFRSVELNKKLGGSSTSQHCKGEAMDIDDTYGHMSNADMFNFIKDNLDFDQMIWEYGDNDNPDWVHVSYKKSGNRKEILRCQRINGKTVYSHY